jgi:predicted short-subunit dehydrogenase-like oxidoreductase (DUF2520 family)
VTVSVVGGGRLGTALAIALSQQRYAIEAVVCRTASSAKRAAALIGGSTLPLTVAHLDRLPQSDILLITTPDDAIAGVAQRIASNYHPVKKGRVALHASGALSSLVLTDLTAKGYAVGSVHPLVSVSDSVQGAGALSEAYFCIEGQARAVSAARALVTALGGKSFSIAAKNKALYHAAAVMASGNVVALFDIAVEMLARCGLTARDSREVLLPLLQSTTRNLTAREPARALTGTFARADQTTAELHLSALRSSNLVDAARLYILLGMRSLELALQAGMSESAVTKLEELLLRCHEDLASVSRRPGRAQ